MEQNQNKSKASIAYSIIRDRILSGEYGYGEILSSNKLSEELGMSRTPITEALKMLETEELVTVVPQVGTMVKPMNLEHVIGQFKIRAFIEGYLAGEAAKRADDILIRDLTAVIDLMGDCINRGDKESYAQLNTQFHELIMDAALEPYLKDTVQQQLSDQNRYRNFLPFIFTSNMNESFEEHKAIVDAIVERDEKKARTLMENHVIVRRKIAWSQMF